jgi:hypothetical protein|tara:strand:+ start:6769 stop:7167 length:399 start_codon:yes stop_codon:yes gene_type:complete
MGYPDPKDLRAWAGIKRNSDDDTDPQVPLFNWDDLDIRSSPRSQKVPAYFARVEISMHADLASPRLAMRKAKQEFLYYSGRDYEDIRWVKIIKESENVLFSSIKKVYNVEVQATKGAVAAYYRGKTRHRMKK